MPKPLSPKIQRQKLISMCSVSQREQIAFQCGWREAHQANHIEVRNWLLHNWENCGAYLVTRARMNFEVMAQGAFK